MVLLGRSSASTNAPSSTPATNSPSSGLSSSSGASLAQKSTRMPSSSISPPMFPPPPSPCNTHNTQSAGYCPPHLHLSSRLSYACAAAECFREESLGSVWPGRGGDTGGIGDSFPVDSGGREIHLPHSSQQIGLLQGAPRLPRLRSAGIHPPGSQIPIHLA